jgi:hypothetical protein
MQAAVSLGDYSKGMASLNEGFATELKSLELQEDA